MYESAEFERLVEDTQPVRGHPHWLLAQARNERAQARLAKRQAAVRLAQRRELSARVHDSSRTMWAKLGLLALVPAWIVAAVILAALLLGGCAPRRVPVTGSQAAEAAAQAAPTGAADREATRPVISPSPTARMTATAPVKKTCEVFTGWIGPDRMSVNVRGGPGMDAPVVDVVHTGEALILTGRVEGGWSEVVTPKLVTGWFYCSQWCECEVEEGAAKQ